MPNKDSLKRQLTKTISIEIVPTDGSSTITERIWAINWFDFKNKWLYNLYNRLASKYVVQVGGQLLFKGYLHTTLVGKPILKRQTLLIVTYPRVDDFLEMLTIKSFQLVSLLRVKAVKNFVFGFMKREDQFKSNQDPLFSLKNKYLVFHYQGNLNKKLLISFSKKAGLQLYFSGEKLAQVKRSEVGKPVVLSPFFMDGIIVFEHSDQALLEAFVSSDDFSSVIARNTTNYAAIFTRIK